MPVWGDNFYSRLVAGMKIILPLAALGLLSTMFLLSRKVDPTATIPYASETVEDSARMQGATNPSFSGVTDNGEQILMRATSARPDPADENQILSDDITAQLRLLNGTVIDITSEAARVDQGSDLATLEGNVRIETSTGYDLRTSLLSSRFSRIHAVAPNRVEGSGLSGQITAGRMLLTGNPDTEHIHLLFTDGVKLVYRPGKPED